MDYDEYKNLLMRHLHRPMSHIPAKELELLKLMSREHSQEIDSVHIADMLHDTRHKSPALAHVMSRGMPHAHGGGFLSSDNQKNLEERLRNGGFDPTLAENMLLHGTLRDWFIGTRTKGGKYLQTISNELNGYSPYSSIIDPGHMEAVNSALRLYNQNPNVEWTRRNLLDQINGYRSTKRQAIEDTDSIRNSEHHSMVKRMFEYLQGESQKHVRPEGEYMFRGIGDSHGDRSAQRFDSETRHRTPIGLNALNSFSTDPRNATEFSDAHRILAHVRPKDTFLHHRILMNDNDHMNEREVWLHQGIKHSPLFYVRTSDDENAVYGKPQHLQEHAEKIAKFLPKLDVPGEELERTDRPYKMQIATLAELLDDLDAIITIQAAYNDDQYHKNINNKVTHLPITFEQIDNAINDELGIPHHEYIDDSNFVLYPETITKKKGPI